MGALVLALYLVCQYKADIITSSIEERLCTATDLAWQVRGPVTPSFLPFLGLAVDNITLLSSSPQKGVSQKLQNQQTILPFFFVQRVRVYYDIGALFHGNPYAYGIVLDSPVLTLADSASSVHLSASVDGPLAVKEVSPLELGIVAGVMRRSAIEATVVATVAKVFLAVDARSFMATGADSPAAGKKPASGVTVNAASPSARPVMKSGTGVVVTPYVRPVTKSSSGIAVSPYARSTTKAGTGVVVSPVPKSVVKKNAGITAKPAAKKGAATAAKPVTKKGTATAAKPAKMPGNATNTIAGTGTQISKSSSSAASEVKPAGTAAATSGARPANQDAAPSIVKPAAKDAFKDADSSPAKPVAREANAEKKAGLVIASIMTQGAAEALLYSKQAVVTARVMQSVAATTSLSPSSAGTFAPPDPLAPVAHFLADLADADLPPVQVTNGTVRILNGGGAVLEIVQLVMEIDPAVPDAPVTASARIFVPGAGLGLTVAGSASLGSHQDVVVQAQVSGGVSMVVPGAIRPVQGSFSTSAIWNNRTAKITFPDFMFAAEGDGLTANLSFDLPTLFCTGKVSIQNISLPRWFEFGRLVPPGLQETLNAVTGTFDLVLSPQGAEAFSLKGKAGDIAVDGYVGASDFSHPVVRVDVFANEGNLDLILPFMAAGGTTVRDPAPLLFLHPPLAPYPDFKKDKSDSISVGYDIRIHIAQFKTHHIQGGALDVLVFPAGDDARIAFATNNFLSGKVQGYLNIGDAQVDMHYAVDKARLDPLPENVGSPVRFGGVVSGVADIGIKVSADGIWAKQWQFTGQANAENLRISSHSDLPWHLLMREVKATGEGIIYTVRKEGIRLDGLWNLAGQGVSSSWNPKGQDPLALNLKGALAWPALAPQEVLPSTAKPVFVQRGLNHIYGALSISGSLAVLLGKQLVPASGKLLAKLDWALDKGHIFLDDASFDGLGSYIKGDINIDTSGRFAMTMPAVFTIAPRTLLKSWNLLPEAVQMPELFSGKSQIQMSPSSVVFGALEAQLDGSSITGEVRYATDEGGRKDSPGLWKVNISTQRMDFDKYFIPQTPAEKSAPPSRVPWRLGAFDGLGIEGQLFFQHSRFRDFSLHNTRATVALQRNKFSIASQTEGFYDGNSTLHVQGALMPTQSKMVVNSAHIEMKKVDIAKMLYDVQKSTSYGGKLDLTMEFFGTMGCNADMPENLSGTWGMSIDEGLYPAFLGSSTAGLRNTFSKATASGPLNKGVVQWDNFVLSGTLVDMDGKGWVDLGKKTMDFGMNVTLAKVPTVPVTITGTFAAPVMSIRGARAVVSTAQAAGNTMFDLVKGIFELPIKAVQGVGEMLSPAEKNTPSPKPPTANNPAVEEKKLKDAPLGR